MTSSPAYSAVPSPDAPLDAAQSDATAEIAKLSRREKLLGSTIGPYRLTSILGHGGTGTVYLGERVDSQYSAQVAVKIVESAAHNADIGQRFKAERQILASLNHPNIARLVDAGETQNGYPYLVMEYVCGEPIDRYCDRLQLTIEQRIELLLNVCSAVQFAHQNLVVHRDLKPGNILVTADGTPKLLDFGIAKLLDTSNTAATLALTRMNDRLLTPEYASPEQILGQNITTSSDVYSLGMVLFELLTGLRPYQLSSVSQLELERTICVVDAARASAVIRQALTATNSETPPEHNIHSIAAARQSTPMRLRAQLEGDLDSILLRSLRKEVGHRYSSVEELTNDLRRHLVREPVLARQGNWVYYTQRFARRHALSVSLGTAFIAMLSAALVYMSIQNQRIAEQRDAANREKKTSAAVASFMVNVFASADPFTVQDRQITAKDLLDGATDNIRSDVRQEPAVKARLLEAIGRSYSRQGSEDRGIALIQDALKIRLEVEGANSANIASTLLNLGRAQRAHNDIAAAEASFEAAQELLGTQSKSAAYADVLVELGRVALQKGVAPRARTLLEQAIPLLRELHGAQHVEVGAALISLGYTLQWQNNYSAAHAATREAVEIYATTLPELHPDRLTAESLFAEVLLSEGQVDAAAQIVERTFDKKQKAFGLASLRIAGDLLALVNVRTAQHRYSEAEAYARSLIDLYTTRLSKANNLTAYARTTLAMVLWKRERFSDAEHELRSALSAFHSSLPENHPYIASAEYYLAESLLGLNKINDAIAQAQITVTRLQQPDMASWRIARSENTLGQALFVSGKIAEAQSNLENSYRVLSTSVGVDLDTVQLAYARLENFYTARGNQSALTALHASKTSKATPSPH